MMQGKLTTRLFWTGVPATNSYRSGEPVMMKLSGADLEFGNGGLFYINSPQSMPTLIDHTHQCMVIM